MTSSKMPLSEEGSIEFSACFAESF